MQSTALDPGNANIRGFFADTYSDLAGAEVALAASEGVTAADHQQHLRSARHLYRQSLEIWQDLQARNILAPADKGKKDAVLQKIVETDAALQ